MDQTTQDVFETIATYDEIAHEYALNIDSKLDHEELELFLQQVKPGGKILDVGCAAGRDGSYFMKHGFEVVGIDLSKGLLAEAKRLHPEVATRLMDMRKLDFADEAFDGVWAHASLLHLKRKDVTKALGEFFRVLKHNGVCFVKVKRGEGQLLVDDGNTGGKKRLMTYFELDELTMIVKRAGFVIEQAQIHNSYKMGTSKRDIDWVVVLGRKLS